MPFCDFIAGSLGGMLGVLAGHPLDTVKVSQQILHSGMAESTRMIYAQGGIRGFFRGVKFPLIAYGGVNSLFFGIYAHTLEYLIREDKCPLPPLGDDVPSDLPDYGYFPEAPVALLEMEAEEERIRRFHASYTSVLVAGGVAGVAQLALMCPVEVIKVRQQVGSPGSDTGIFRYCYLLVQTHGVKSLYKGFIPSVLREGPSSAIYMIVYHFGTRVTFSFSETHDDWIHYAGLFTAGGVAGVVSWWVILPLDVVKSKIQSDDLKSPMFRGTYDCAKQVWKKQGIKGFFRGFVPISLRAFPINGITFLFYELFVQLCHLHVT